jgi:hypothetical protein
MVNDAAVKRFVKECPEQFTDAIETAINKAAARIRYLVKRETPNQWGINKNEMKGFKLRRALKRQGDLTALVVLRGSNVPLFRFLNVTPRNIMGGQTTGGVSVMIANQSHKFRSAFVAQMPTGHIGIYERTGKKTKSGKKEITELTTASVTGMTASENTGIPDRIAPMVQKEFENAFKREAVAWLNLLGAK